MAKTVFGMPGVGKKAEEGDSPSTNPTKAANPISTPVSKPPVATPSRASMAKPVAAPMAKPSAPSTPAATPAAGAGNRTMFGMPAMKLPSQTSDTSPSPSPSPKPAEVRERLSPMYASTQATGSLGPRGAATAGNVESQDKMAFKETVLGMAAVRQEAESVVGAPSLPVSEPVMPETPRKDPNSTPALGMSTGAAAPPAPALDIPVSDSVVSSDVMSDEAPIKKKKKKKKAAPMVEPPPPPKSKINLKVILIIGAVLAAVGVGVGLFTSFATPEPPVPNFAPPTLPNQPQQPMNGIVPPPVPPPPPAPPTQPAPAQ